MTRYHIGHNELYCYIYIYKLDDLATLCCDTEWLHGWEISVFPKTTVSTLFSVIIFTGRPFPYPTFKVESTLFFHYFYISPLPTLSHTIDKVSTFSISSTFDVTKLQKKSWCLIDWQLSIPKVSGHAYSYSLPPLWRCGLNLDLNGIERVIIHLGVPENYGFDTIIRDYFYRSPFPTTPLYGC